MQDANVKVQDDPGTDTQLPPTEATSFAAGSPSGKVGACHCDPVFPALFSLWSFEQALNGDYDPFAIAS